ncbi:ABC transporter substrate-binding protein [Roseomonas sp. AR75]|jgi:NitT/TauT family transport system substrate-binding protein|uniref:ABC transporter substrate-binding protein n=1 Tax=Roseomonas sp. AR75 TaxID=2562311 RepID=UPI001484DD72|nr:ABC transporter substrate-binding protein [Roseomonas sp. AR75]
MSGIGRRGLGKAGAAGIVAAAMGGRAARAQAPKVRIWGASATIEAYHGFLFLGIPLGFYRDNGIDAEFGTAAGSAATLQLVATNQAQLGYVGMETMILAKQRNPTLPITAVYLQDRGNIYEIVVPEDSGIRQIADLKDKNIGVANLASGAIPSLRAMLVDAGLNADSSVGLIPVGNGAAAATALRTNRVQALSLFRAQHAVIETLGIKLRYFQRDQPSAVLIANTNWMRQNPDAVVGALRGVVAGSIFAQVAPEATVREHWKMFTRPTGLSEEEAMARAKHVLTRSSELWKRWDDASTQWGSMTKDQWDRMQAFMVQQKLMPQPIDSATLFTTDFIGRVNAMDTGAIVQRARAA